MLIDRALYLTESRSVLTNLRVVTTALSTATSFVNEFVSIRVFFFVLYTRSSSRGGCPRDPNFFVNSFSNSVYNRGNGVTRISLRACR